MSHLPTDASDAVYFDVIGNSTSDSTPVGSMNRARWPSTGILYPEIGVVTFAPIGHLVRFEKLDSIFDAWAELTTGRESEIGSISSVRLKNWSYRRNPMVVRTVRIS
jgi:hypothetical protein